MFYVQNFFIGDCVALKIEFFAFGTTQPQVLYICVDIL